MVVDVADTAGDGDREGMPAQLCRILIVQIVLAVLAGTATVFDDVLVIVADDNRKILVGFDATLADGSMARTPRSPCRREI